MLADELRDEGAHRDHPVIGVLSHLVERIPNESTSEAVLALRRLAGERLHGVDAHIVIYAYMGVYPRTPDGATRLLTENHPPEQPPPPTAGPWHQHLPPAPTDAQLTVAITSILTPPAESGN